MNMSLAGKVAGLLCSLLMLTAAMSGGDDRPQAYVTFTSRTGLVLVPVVVQDKSGEAAAGLTKDDFELQENGKSKPIATFEEVKTLTNRPSRPAPQSGVYTNELSNDSSPKRMTIFALDLVNTPFLDQAYAREQLIKFLANRVGSQEPIALVLINRNGIKVLHDFTSDPAVLVAALKKVSGEIPGVYGVGVNEEISAEAQELNGFVSGTGLEAYVMLAQREAIMVTLESFQHVAEAYAGVPGRKSLIWATAAFPFGLDPVTGTILSPTVFHQGVNVSGNQYTPRSGALPPLPESTSIQTGEDLKSLEPLYQRTLQMLNDASISVYPVDARGLLVFFPGADISKIAGVSAYNKALFDSSRDTMVGFADMTGGKAFYNRNDLDTAFQKAADDSASYYMLGYYLDKNAKPGWHKLHVKLKNGGKEVRARNGFFVMPESTQTDTKKMDLRLALVSPLDYSAVPFSVRWGAVQGQGAKKKVHFQINLPPSSSVVDTSTNGQVDLEVLAAARTATGQSADHFGEHVQANLKPDSLQAFQRDGLNYSNDLLVTAGEYQVRFVVRDNLNGRLGTVTARLQVNP
ncbi:MAG: VWA domain-containing protein [Terriglobales bacterium]|jgi:VWFA-related protein